ncbi:MAG: tautomerase family protein [Pseudomonadota bacterium]
MPLVHISLIKGTPDAHRAAILDGVYEAMRQTFNVPEDDQFITITEHDPSNFRYGKTYLDIERSDDVVFIKISAMQSRTIDQKKALYARLVELLNEKPGLRTEDVFVNIIEGARENWSLGNGLASYA